MAEGGTRNKERKEEKKEEKERMKYLSDGDGGTPLLA